MTVAGVVGVVLMFQLDRVVLDGPGLTGLDAVGDLPAPLRPLSESARSEAGGLRLGAMGLALGSAAGAWLELALLRRRHRSIAGQLRMGGGQLARVLGASAALAVVAIVLRPVLVGLPPLVALPLVAVPAAVVYLGVADRIRVKEAATLLEPLRRRRHRK